MAPPNLSAARPRRLRKALVALSALAVGLGAAIAPSVADTAEAAVLTEPAFTSVQVVDDEAFNHGAVRVNVEGFVPAGARAGDETLLQMPDVLRVGSGSFDVRTPDGSVIGTASSVNSGASLRLVYTDYVSQHTDVTFSGFFTAVVNDPSLGDNESAMRNLVFTDAGASFRDSLRITNGNPSSRDLVFAKGRWLKPDRGAVEVENSIEWSFESRNGESSNGFLPLAQRLTFHNHYLKASGDQFTEDGPALSTFDCSTLSFFRYTADEHKVLPAEFEALRQPLAPSEYTVESCSADSITVLFPNVPAGMFYGATVQATPVDPNTALNLFAGVEGHAATPGYGWRSFWNTLVMRTAEDIAGEGLVGVRTVAPSLSPAESCGVEATVNIPTVTGVEYTQTRDGNVVHVTATATSGYKIEAGAETSWTFEIPAVEPCPGVVVPVAPTLNLADECGVESTVTIPDHAALTYTEERKGNVVAVTAAAKEGFEIEEGAQVVWTFEIPEVISCDEPVAPVLPTVQQAVCDATTGTVSDPVVTFAETKGIDYLAKRSEDGKTATLTATAQEGFVLAEAEGWKLADDALTATAEVSFGEVECLKGEEQPAPKQLATTGADASLPAVLLAGFAVLVGSALFAATRIRRAEQLTEILDS